MCGIFAYYNYNCERERGFICDTLLNGLQRLEYRGYDSAGISVDDEIDAWGKGPKVPVPLIIREKGKIEKLRKKVMPPRDS